MRSIRVRFSRDLTGPLPMQKGPNFQGEHEYDLLTPSGKVLGIPRPDGERKCIRGLL